MISRPDYAPPPAEGDFWKKPGVAVASFAALVLAIAALVYVVIPRPSSAPPLGGVATSAAPTPVTAYGLVAAYEANEINADASFKGQSVIVSGVVGEIGKDILGTPYVTLSGGNARQAREVQCLFDDSSVPALAKLAKGQRLSVQGRVDGMMVNVLVRDCSIKTP